MILNDNLGNSTQIEFRDVQRDMSLDMELFEFEAPDKVDVIDMREHGE
jgi:outer membrane lipoprotein-sorting protein